MKLTLICFCLYFIAFSGTKFTEHKAVSHHPNEIFTPDLRIPSNEYARAVTQRITSDQYDGIVVGTTDYDYAINSGFARRIATYNNGAEVHMVFDERDISLPSPNNRRAAKYVFYNSATGYIKTAYPHPKAIGSTGFASLDVLPAGSKAGTAVMTYSSGGQVFFAIDSGPGQGTFTENIFPDAISKRAISEAQLTCSPDGNVIWLSANVSNNDYLIAKSTDNGQTWIVVDSLKKYVPHSGYMLNMTTAPLLIAPDGTLYRLTTLKGKGSLPPLGDAHSDSADCIGYFKSTDNGAHWAWTTIGRDGDPLVVTSGDTVYVLFENFSQFSGTVDNYGNIQVVSNGYCVKPISDVAVSNRFYTLYYKTGFSAWRIISNVSDGNRPEYDSSYYKYSGNAIGHPYPTISVSNNSDHLLAIWSQPIFTNGKLDTTGGFVQYSLWQNESFNSGNTWRTAIECNNTTGALFVTASPRSHWNGSSLEVPSFYLADTVRGCAVFGDHDPVQVPWRFRTFTGVVINDIGEEIRSAKKFFLSQNYPNPFNPLTTIYYEVVQDGNVTIEVYDVLGRSVVLLVSEFKRAGTYAVLFDGSQLSSGVYIYKMTSGNFSAVKKMVLQK